MSKNEWFFSFTQKEWLSRQDTSQQSTQTDRHNIEKITPKTKQAIKKDFWSRISSNDALHLVLKRCI